MMKFGILQLAQASAASLHRGTSIFILSSYKTRFYIQMCMLNHYFVLFMCNYKAMCCCKWIPVPTTKFKDLPPVWISTNKNLHKIAIQIIDMFLFSFVFEVKFNLFFMFDFCSFLFSAEVPTKVQTCKEKRRITSGKFNRKFIKNQREYRRKNENFMRNSFFQACEFCSFSKRWKMHFEGKFDAKKLKCIKTKFARLKKHEFQIKCAFF